MRLIVEIESYLNGADESIAEALNVAKALDRPVPIKFMDANIRLEVLQNSNYYDIRRIFEKDVQILNLEREIRELRNQLSVPETPSQVSKECVNYENAEDPLP